MTIFGPGATNKTHPPSRKRPLLALIKTPPNSPRQSAAPVLIRSVSLSLAKNGLVNKQPCKTIALNHKQRISPRARTASFCNLGHLAHRSEERRVGKEWRSRWGT